MNNWGRDREIEKPKPWADRARKCSANLEDHISALKGLFGESSAPLVRDLRRAIELLDEADIRGLQGKEPGL
jgi:hypothetical protein